MPSLVAACRQGFPNPDVFDPDRFDPAGRNEGAVYQTNFLAFGVGAHYCVGREYAMNHVRRVEGLEGSRGPVPSERLRLSRIAARPPTSLLPLAR